MFIPAPKRYSAKVISHKVTLQLASTYRLALENNINTEILGIEHQTNNQTILRISFRPEPQFSPAGPR